MTPCFLWTTEIKIGLEIIGNESLKASFVVDIDTLIKETESDKTLSKTYLVRLKSDQGKSQKSLLSFDVAWKNLGLNNF